MKKVTSNGVTLTKTNEGNHEIIRLISKELGRIVDMSKSLRTGEWFISLCKVEVAHGEAITHNLRSYSKKDLGFAMRYLDKKQHEFGFFPSSHAH